MLGDFGMVVQDELGDNAPGFSVGVGIKGLIAKVSNGPIYNNTTAVAMGGLVRYSPPATRRLGIVGEVYASPNIITFGDANRYLEDNAAWNMKSSRIRWPISGTATSSSA